MPSRRTHSKSHHGCDQCKQRRIKCDEVRPTCGSCRKKTLACVFKSVGPVLASNLPNLATDIVRRDQPPSLPLQDLELMHHWHTATVDTLDSAKPLQDVIRIAMPHEGLRNPFLMHSILAVAAVHLAHSTPADRRQGYIETAMMHHNRSLALCAPFVKNITRQNCHALFAFSCLVPIFVFASQTSRMSPRTQSLAEVVETLKLIRGISSVVEQARPWIEEGPMHPLLRVGKFHHPSEVDEQHAQRLYSKLQTLEENLLSPVTEESLTRRDIPRDAVQWLRHMLEIYIDTGDSRALMAWPVLVDAAYFDLLLQKERISVLMLGLFGSSLEVHPQRWWLDGTGQGLVALATENLSLADREILSSNLSIAK
ncbi:C6 zinc finger domain protein [Aspergillus pseudodeflectus]|uniref:C6 zinc finger domain protein n=1 Tax=Aspergillus pseudodeflectus TaxID=176178 RepID=A0ABR4KWR3_9EURO